MRWVTIIAACTSSPCTHHCCCLTPSLATLTASPSTRTLSWRPRGRLSGPSSPSCSGRPRPTMTACLPPSRSPQASNRAQPSRSSVRQKRQSGGRRLASMTTQTAILTPILHSNNHGCQTNKIWNQVYTLCDALHCTACADSSPCVVWSVALLIPTYMYM